MNSNPILLLWSLTIFCQPPNTIHVHIRKTNLSNTATSDSIGASVAASGSNVYVSWWEKANQTSNEPVMRVSNDNGKNIWRKDTAINEVIYSSRRENKELS